MPVLGCQPVLHRHEDRAEVGHPVENQVDPAEAVAEHQPARVRVDHPRALTRRILGTQHRHGDLVPVRSDDNVVGADDALGEKEVLDGRGGVGHAHEVDEVGRDRRREHAADHRQAGPQLGVERRARDGLHLGCHRSLRILCNQGIAVRAP